MRTVLLSALLCFSAGATAQLAASIAYAPKFELCPQETELVREVGAVARKQTLSNGEAEYVARRQSQVLPQAWRQYFENVKRQTEKHAALPTYVSDIFAGHHGFDALPTLGIATSGGSYRAAIFGAGVLNALDGRNQTSVDAGTGGLLQAATYLTGLSGGSWLVLSLSQANFPMLPDLIFGTSDSQGSDGFGSWITDIDVLQPGNSTVTTAYVGGLVEEISLKWTEGFPVSVTDVWGRALGRHFVNGSTAADFFDPLITHGAGITLSSLTNVPTFMDHTQPFTIVTANSLTSRSNGTAIIEPGNIVPLMNPIYEFNVFESGSFDPALGAFTPTKFLGSRNGSVCTTGFDQLSFIEGASSNLFNEFNTSAAALEASSIGPIVDALKLLYPQTNVRLDVAQLPNPFVGVSNATFPDTDQELLALVDGGEDGEVVPLQPLLVKARGVDTIFVIDAPADTADNFADGSSIVASQHRVSLFPSTYSFPPTPATADDFLAQNLTRRPTFFGCNSPASSEEPLLIYLANGGPPLGQPAVTNASTSQLSYTTDQVQVMLDEIFDVATQGIATEALDGQGEKDPLWPACLACAVVDRSRRDSRIAREGICHDCLLKYCWS